MPTISIQWHATLDERTCPICRSIHGFKWTFQTGQQPLPDNLVHPSYGTVWNTAIGSQAHGHEVYNCRCSIIPDFDMSDLIAQVEQLMVTMRQDVEYVEFMRRGQLTGAWRSTETGQFVSGP